MKKILILATVIIGIFGLTSCNKDDDNPSSTSKIRYYFQANKPGNYDVSYYLDTANANPSGGAILANTGVFDKTVQAATGKVTKLMVLPPQNWTIGDTSSAILQIYVNDVLKVSDTTVVSASDLPGNWIYSAY